MTDHIYEAISKVQKSLAGNLQKITRDELLFRLLNARHLIDWALRVEDGIENSNSNPPEEHEP